MNQPDKGAVERFLNNLPSTEGQALLELSEQSDTGSWNGATILACRAGIADHFLQIADTLRDPRLPSEPAR